MPRPPVKVGHWEEGEAGAAARWAPTGMRLALEAEPTPRSHLGPHSVLRADQTQTPMQPTKPGWRRPPGDGCLAAFLPLGQDQASSKFSMLQYLKGLNVDSSELVSVTGTHP